MRARCSAIAAIATGALVAWAALSARGGGERSAHARAEKEVHVLRIEGGADRASRTRDESGARDDEAPSLQGTEVDGALPLDANGHFEASEEVLRMFDYFLSTRGERSDREIRDRVEREARRRVGDAEALRVVRLFDRYRAYREDLASRVTRVTAGDLRGALEETRKARIAAFGATEATRMFATEDAIAARFVGEAEIRNDVALDESTRAVRLAALDEALPPELRALRAERERVMNEVQARVRAAGDRGRGP